MEGRGGLGREVNGDGDKGAGGGRGKKSWGWLRERMVGRDRDW